ncbi:MAG: hypothetical protein JWO52_4029 [Gammaproteobacteria bacterium]|nr:hypothetical protein [Gammaproteobacteria bacterium]
MAVPIEPDGPGWRALAIGAGLLLTSLFGWIANALRNEQKEQGTQLALIRSNYVSRSDLEKDLALLRADNLRMNQESRAEVLRLHASNEAYLQRIENKIERGSQTRHDILGGVDAIQLMLRATLKQAAAQAAAAAAKDQKSNRDSTEG